MVREFKEYPQVNLSDFTDESSAIRIDTQNSTNDIISVREKLLASPLEEIKSLRPGTREMLEKYFGCSILEDLVNLDIERIIRYDQSKNGDNIFKAKRIENLKNVLDTAQIPYTNKGPAHSCYNTRTIQSLFMREWEDNRETLIVLNRILELGQTTDEYPTIRQTDGGYKNYYELTPTDIEGVSLKDFKKEYEKIIQSNRASKAYKFLIKMLDEKSIPYIDEKGKKQNQK